MIIMKKFSLTLIFLLMLVSLTGQTGYKYKSNFVELKADSSVFFIQTTGHNAKSRIIQLEN